MQNKGSGGKKGRSCLASCLATLAQHNARQTNAVLATTHFIAMDIQRVRRLVMYELANQVQAQKT